MKKLIYSIVLLISSSTGLAPVSHATEAEAVTQPEQTAVLFVYAQSSDKNPVLLKSVSQAFQQDQWEVVMYPLTTEQMQSNYRYLAFDQKIKSLVDAGYQRIIVMGYDDANKLVTYYLAGIPSRRIKAFVGINMTGHRTAGNNVASDNASSLLNIHIPVLDIFGSQSHPLVLASTERRAFAMTLHRTGCDCAKSRQVVIENADAMFQGYENHLTMQIANWLKSI